MLAFLKMFFQYSLRMLIVVVAVVAAYFPLARIYHSWFTKTYGSYYIASVIGSKIHDGDSIADVARHFDTHRLLTKSDTRHMKNITEFCNRNNLPIEECDEFHTFSVSTGGVDLQFRDGRLVNLQNNLYSDAAKLSQINSYSLPNPILAFGFLPLYFVLLTCILLVYLWLHRPDRTNNRDSAADKIGVTQTARPSDELVR
jgi:hypothetical protein